MQLNLKNSWNSSWSEIIEKIHNNVQNDLIALAIVSAALKSVFSSSYTTW